MVGPLVRVWSLGSTPPLNLTYTDKNGFRCCGSRSSLPSQGAPRDRVGSWNLRVKPTPSVPCTRNPPRHLGRPSGGRGWPRGLSEVPLDTPGTRGRETDSRRFPPEPSYDLAPFSDAGTKDPRTCVVGVRPVWGPVFQGRGTVLRVGTDLTTHGTPEGAPKDRGTEVETFDSSSTGVDRDGTEFRPRFC